MECMRAIMDEIMGVCVVCGTWSSAISIASYSETTW